MKSSESPAHGLCKKLIIKSRNSIPGRGIDFPEADPHPSPLPSDGRVIAADLERLRGVVSNTRVHVPGCAATCSPRPSDGRGVRGEGFSETTRLVKSASFALASLLFFTQGVYAATRAKTNNADNLNL